MPIPKTALAVGLALVASACSKPSIKTVNFDGWRVSYPTSASVENKADPTMEIRLSQKPLCVVVISPYPKPNEPNYDLNSAVRDLTSAFPPTWKLNSVTISNEGLEHAHVDMKVKLEDGSYRPSTIDLFLSPKSVLWVTTDCQNPNLQTTAHNIVDSIAVQS